MSKFETSLLFKRSREGVELEAALKNFSYLEEKIKNVFVEYPEEFSYQLLFKNTKGSNQYFIFLDIFSPEKEGMDRLNKLKNDLKNCFKGKNTMGYFNYDEYSNSDSYVSNVDFKLGVTELN